MLTFTSKSSFGSFLLSLFLAAGSAGAAEGFEAGAAAGLAV